MNEKTIINEQQNSQSTCYNPRTLWYASLFLLMLGLLSIVTSSVFAQEKPRWDLSTNAIVPTLCAGTVEKVDGKVKLRDGAAFAIPAEAFPDQRNFTVQLTLSVDELPGKSEFAFMNKQSDKDDGFAFSIMNRGDQPGNYQIDASVNKILMESWLACGKTWPELGKPYTFNMVVRNGYATFYHDQKPIKTCLMEMLPNALPMWIGRSSNLRSKQLPVTIHGVKVYGSEYNFVSTIEENSNRRMVGGKGWAMDIPKTIEHAEWPKVLIYGDSNSGGYGPFLSTILEKNNAYFFHSIGFVNRDVPELALTQLASSFKFDLIVFNNGLHSLGWTKETVADAVVTDRMRKIAQSFKKGAPQAKIFYLSTTPHTALRPTPDQPVNSLGDKNDVVIRLNTLSEVVMKEEKIEWIDIYSMMAAKLELARGDNFHWQKSGYEMMAQKVADRMLPFITALSKQK